MSLFGDGLDSLAPLVGGSVHDGRLRGTWDGHPLEVSLSRGDPRPEMQFSPGHSGGSVNQLTLELSGVSGGRTWKCERRPVHLNPLAPLEVCFADVLPPGLAGVATALGTPMPDPETQQRLQDAGLLTEIARLVTGAAWLPIVSFKPSGEEMLEHQMARVPGFVGIDQAALDRLRANSALTFLVEVDRGKVPTREWFEMMLDVVARVARINAEVNTSPEASPVAPPPTVSSGPLPSVLAETILGSWSSAFMDVDFRADGSMTASRGGKHRDGRWSVGPDGRLLADAVNDDRNQAWIDGDELTVVVKGMGLKFQRSPR